MGSDEEAERTAMIAAARKARCPDQETCFTEGWNAGLAHARQEADEAFHKWLAAANAGMLIRERRAEKAEAQVAALEAVAEAAGFSTPYPLTDVLEQLADAAQHLLDYHSCDTHGHEGIREAMIAARRIREALDRAQPEAQKDSGSGLDGSDARTANALKPADGQPEPDRSVKPQPWRRNDRRD